MYISVLAIVVSIVDKSDQFIKKKMYPERLCVIKLFNFIFVQKCFIFDKN